LSVTFAEITVKSCDIRRQQQVSRRRGRQVAANTMNSYRSQAERRASLSRPHVPVAGRATGRAPLEQPPWGYGSGRHVSSTPITNNTKRQYRPRTRSASPAKQTISCCETALAQQATACARPSLENTAALNWPNSPTYRGQGTGVTVEPKSADYSAEKSTPNEMSVNVNTATVIVPDVQAQHPYSHGAIQIIGDTAMTGGGPVNSSSMETWTTSSSPPVQSTISSPHNLDTPKQNSTIHTPTSPPQSATSWLRRLSPTSPTLTTTNSARLEQMLAAAESAIRDMDAVIKPTSLSSDVTASPKLITPSGHPTANEPVTVEAREMTPTSLSSTHEQKGVTTSANDSTAPEEDALDTPVSLNSSKGSTPCRVSSRTNPLKSPTMTATPKANEQEKSSLMVGLVKVKSQHTGQMIDCPILETLYTNEVVDESSTPAVRQSSSHKVVLIKAVVPRWAWNRRGQSTPDSSSRASLSSVRTNDRFGVDNKMNKRKSYVSVNTQTSDTLMSVRRTTSEHQSTPSSPITVANTHMYVPALQDECHLTPSPKLSACFAKCKSTPWSPTAESHISSLSNNTNFLSSAPAQSKNLISAETPSLQTSPFSHGNMSMMSEKPKESESIQRPSTSMDYDSLMEDTVENLKLDLQFSSSDSDSVTHEKVAAKRSHAECCNYHSSSSSDELESSDDHGKSTLNWCTATAATALSNAVEKLKTSGYIDELAACVEPSPPSPPHQKSTSARRSVRTPSSQRRSPATYLDNCLARADDSARLMSNSKCQSNPNSSQRIDIKARLTPDGCSRPPRSPCPWRSSTSNVVEQESWSERNFSCQDTHQYQHQQHLQSPSLQQRTSSTHASRSASSLSDRSKSTKLDYCEMTTMKASPTMSPRSSHIEKSSSPAQRQLVTSGGSDTCYTTEPLDGNTHHHHRHHRYSATNEFQSINQSKVTGAVKSTTNQSSYNHRRSTPGKKLRAVEAKPPIQERNKVLTSVTKRFSERQHKGDSAVARHSDVVAQSSYSAGSMAVLRNAWPPTATTKRQHSKSASRHMRRDANANKRSLARNMATDRRPSSSQEQYCSIRDIQRRGHVHNDKHSTLEPASRRSAEQVTSSGRRQRHGSRPINASVSRSADSVSRDRGRRKSVHTNYIYPTSVQSNSSQPKRTNNRQSRRHDEHQSKAIFYDCRQPVVHCSPRSLKPFRPPVSDRCSPSSFDNSAADIVGTSLDGETAPQYVFVQRQEHNKYGGDRPGCRPSNVPPPRRQEGLYHLEQTSNAAAAGGRRRKKLPATPDVIGQGWHAQPEFAVHIPVASVVERPAWR